MRYSAQIRAARALLGIRQEELAKSAKIGLATIQRIEQTPGVVQANFSTVMKIQSALQRAGVEFIDGEQDVIGVTVRRRNL